MKKLIIVLGLLTMGAMAQTHKPSIALQKACYDQAAKVADKGVQWANHYDPRSKTCWVEEWTNTTNPVVYSRWVFNAFEKDSTESYFMGEIGKAPYMCFVGATPCRSGEEFDILVSRRYGL